jgi:hypothetical protein
VLLNALLIESLLRKEVEEIISDLRTLAFSIMFHRMTA